MGSCAAYHVVSILVDGGTHHSNAVRGGTASTTTTRSPAPPAARPLFVSLPWPAVCGSASLPLIMKRAIIDSNLLHPPRSSSSFVRFISSRRVVAARAAGGRARSLFLAAPRDASQTLPFPQAQIPSNAMHAAPKSVDTYIPCFNLLPAAPVPRSSLLNSSARNVMSALYSSMPPAKVTQLAAHSGPGEIGSVCGRIHITG